MKRKPADNWLLEYMTRQTRERHFNGTGDGDSTANRRRRIGGDYLIDLGSDAAVPLRRIDVGGGGRTVTQELTPGQNQ
jgi:hypothetical protein